MARYTGPKVKLSRRVGVPIADTPKHTAKRQLNAPGPHGFRGKRPKPYGIRKDEKQKLRYHYGVLERQFRRYLREAGRASGNTGDALLQILEQRLDNVLRRAGFARTIWASRQMVAHGHVLVNGRKCDRPSLAVQVGDTVSFKAGLQTLVRENMESMAGHIVPGWIEVNPAELSVKVTSTPTPDQIPFDVNTNLIIEFYR
ncbi:MAG: 30S ribosomal protein S4 [Planctomycetota bacterium]|nr:30S ribosomal protein S4 [Planctomycetota bacterium]MDA1105977.1 30S ribosomal protein S4 [Planctomycetota bacterium]